MKKIISLLSVLAFIALQSCNESCSETDVYTLQQGDIRIDVPTTGLVATAGIAITINVTTVTDEGISYRWLLEDKTIAETKNLTHTFPLPGQYQLILCATQGRATLRYTATVTVNPNENATPYITKVIEFMPAVGQFVNQQPAYEEGDTQETMNQKVLELIGHNKGELVSLGGYGGYVIVGFDHTIQNVKGKRDFRVLGNAFFSAGGNNGMLNSGSCEPGIIMVAYDANQNGIADNDEWYEIAGSAHIDPTAEVWYQASADAGNNVNLYSNYEITYHRPTNEPSNSAEWNTYIRWEDNQGNSGYKTKNEFHRQPYFPQWITADKLTFKGTCLPQNGIDKSGQGTFYVLHKFHYGYADNDINTGTEAAIDIDWAVNANGERVNLPGVDFIKVYTGVNQENGWTGECSTEISGIEDLHLLGESIDTQI
ncbi:MAG: PKD domain-containing protein [Marinifilaceae bacterium]